MTPVQGKLRCNMVKPLDRTGMTSFRYSDPGACGSSRIGRQQGAEFAEDAGDGAASHASIPGEFLCELRTGKADFTQATGSPGLSGTGHQTLNTPDPRHAFRDLLPDAGMSPALVDDILRSCLIRDVPARTTIQRVADKPGGLWCLAEGALSIEMAPGMRDPQMSYLLLPPVWVGEGGVIVDTPRSVGLSTTRRSVLLHLPAQRFFDIAQKEPLIWRWVAEVQKQNFERAIRMTDALMVRSSNTRIAAVLMQLGGLRGHHNDTPRVLDISQAQLAAIANVSRSILNPVLKELALKGAVELGHRTITITDPSALRGAF